MDKKRKGGAQKLREKKNKLLISEASKCNKLDSFFISSKNVNIPNNSLSSTNSNLIQNTTIILSEKSENISSKTIDQDSKVQASTSFDINDDTFVMSIKCNTESEVCFPNLSEINIEKTNNNSSNLFFCTPLPNERKFFLNTIQFNRTKVSCHSNPC